MGTRTSICRKSNERVMTLLMASIKFVAASLYLLATTPIIVAWSWKGQNLPRLRWPSYTLDHLTPVKHTTVPCVPRIFQLQNDEMHGFDKIPRNIATVLAVPPSNWAVTCGCGDLPRRWSLHCRCRAVQMVYTLAFVCRQMATGTVPIKCFWFVISS